ncbi:hypothetical protein H0X06_05170 [Candidatus Dependentiae bacterium]|nr:hypothetical protein [Candidatus Dependentiae bacterium]
MNYLFFSLCSIFFFYPFFLQSVFYEESALFSGEYSENYIIRWAFQKLCDFSFGPRRDPFSWPTHSQGVSFDPRKVKGGELVFVRDVERFFKTVYRRINHPFIMVTAGEARDKVQKNQIAYLDDKKIIAWFSVHACEYAHPKFCPIPLGIFQEKKYYHHRKNLTHYFSSLRQIPKEKLLYMNFGDVKGKKAERAEVGKIFSAVEYCFKAEKRLPFLEYMQQMSECKFTLSPPGYGPDCYRTWEALLVGSIPIVKTSHLDRLFKDLPVLIIDRWDEITEDFLESAYKRFSVKKHAIKRLFIEYWAQKIEKRRRSFLLASGGKGL